MNPYSTSTSPLPLVLTLTQSQEGQRITAPRLGLTPTHSVLPVIMVQQCFYPGKSFPLPRGVEPDDDFHENGIIIEFVFKGTITLSLQSTNQMMDLTFDLTDLRMTNMENQPIQTHGIYGDLQQIIKMYNLVLNRIITEVDSFGSDVATLMGLKTDRFIYYLYWKHYRVHNPGTYFPGGRLPKAHEILKILPYH